MTRQTKTPRQRAEETVAAARRRVDRLVKNHATAKAALDEISADLDDARIRLAYVQQDPALPSTTTTPTGATA